MLQNIIKCFQGIRKINKIKNCDGAVFYFFGITVVIFLFSLFLFYKISFNQNNEQIVIFDKQAVFADYYHSLLKLNLASKNSASFKKSLQEKNAYFIKSLIGDLHNYQASHHVIIVKRSALAAPDAIQGSRMDITSSIEDELKVQGAILQGAIS